jgi:hypothetical protein
MKQIDQARQEKLAEITTMRQQLANREDREAKQREQTEEAKAALREAVSRARQIETSLAAAEGGSSDCRHSSRPPARQPMARSLPLPQLKRGPAPSRKSDLPKP